MHLKKFVENGLIPLYLVLLVLEMSTILFIASNTTGNAIVTGNFYSRITSDFFLLMVCSFVLTLVATIFSFRYIGVASKDKKISEEVVENLMKDQ